jgi:hypothetical protein
MKLDEIRHETLTLAETLTLKKSSIFFTSREKGTSFSRVPIRSKLLAEFIVAYTWSTGRGKYLSCIIGCFILIFFSLGGGDCYCVIWVFVTSLLNVDFTSSLRILEIFVDFFSSLAMSDRIVLG